MDSEAFFQGYGQRLNGALAQADWAAIAALAEDLAACWREGRQVFLCGNGGSAGNALHIANDLLYGVARKGGRGLRVQALTANVAVLTCLANDEGYHSAFSLQLSSQAAPGDLLIALSGSGNSANILEALATARTQGLKSWAILGYSGGKAKTMADRALHFAVDDMQIAEDLQLIVGHMLMQRLCAE